VLCDRYTDSTLAYQGYGHGQLLTALRQLGDYATGRLLPALTLYLDIDVHIGLERKRTGAAEEWNRMENQAAAFHQRVRQGYLALAAANPERWCLLDAGQPVEVLHSLVLDRVAALLAERRPSPAGQETAGQETAGQETTV
jgi:dTMP kinase